MPTELLAGVGYVLISHSRTGLASRKPYGKLGTCDQLGVAGLGINVLEGVGWLSPRSPKRDRGLGGGVAKGYRLYCRAYSAGWDLTNLLKALLGA